MDLEQELRTEFLVFATSHMVNTIVKVSSSMDQSEQFGVLIVDDEPNIRSGLAKGLAAEADTIDTAADADDALVKFDLAKHPLVIVDVRLNCNMTGLELLTRILQSRPQTAVIVITAHGTVETAVEAMRAGAFDFILKPVDLNLVRTAPAYGRPGLRVVRRSGV